MRLDWERSTGLSVQAEPFALPYDLRDNFAAAGWRTPERHLDEEYWSNISSFVLADPPEVEDGVRRLEADLESGEWHERYGNVMEKQEADAGYYSICMR